MQVTITHKTRPRFVLLALIACLLVAGCYSGAEEVARKLEQELPGLYPEQIEAVSFEFAPPLDPPNLFIDFAPAMSLEDQWRFLCDDLYPRVHEANPAISINNEDPRDWNCR